MPQLNPLLAIKTSNIGAIHKGRPADPRGGGSVESGRSIVIRVWFYCFIRTQGMGGLEILVLARRPLWMAPKLQQKYRDKNSVWDIHGALFTDFDLNVRDPDNLQST